ncbi:uncharacterized protein CLUP02_16079 [Colletotrichum lupini]|uniref:Uncharacterized protein n=1 Tax=Colletotrichum lupini TaxID=145971 RepID=A0A9Q8WP53_9PEZI|nr:uncharacterized protein CLUP02_16079 [Colletotrichum lupini]UQC90549.1 hypothetical protein CLUP02_16079 [Colletotrichum lupini]
MPLARCYRGALWALGPGRQIIAVDPTKSLLLRTTVDAPVVPNKASRQRVKLRDLVMQRRRLHIRLVILGPLYSYTHFVVKRRELKKPPGG